MCVRISTAWFVLVLLCACSVSAQEAFVSGTIVDESGGVLPGVTVTARNLETGRQLVSVTGGHGEYQLRALPAGPYTIQAALAGFATVNRDVELLVGQNATIPFRLKVAALEESVTVSSEAPLVDTRSMQVAGNVDRRQMEELPINGRNWMELSLFVKGITANKVDSTPGVANDRDFQVNLDGQQVTNQRCCSGSFGNAKLSREAIAEYQIVTNLFDVTMGRSEGIQVQAVSKSGTNDLKGSMYGYFRDDKLRAADSFTHTVLPYSNQQAGGTVGGPIVRDRTHYFLSYEYEREPNTVTINPSALGGQILLFPTKFTVTNWLARVDQHAGSNQFMARFLSYQRSNPADSLSTNGYPDRGGETERQARGISGNWTLVASDHVLHEIKVGYFRYHYANYPMAGVPLTPEYIFPGLTIGPRFNYPNPAFSPVFNVGYNLTSQKGRHTLKIGGEYRDGVDSQYYPGYSRGQMFFSARPADFARRFPLDAWNDASKWDFNGLDSLALRFDIVYSNDFTNELRKPTYAAWIGDTWQVADRLSLTLGVRYDLPYSDLATKVLKPYDVIIDNGLFVENVGIKSDIRDLNNVAPRAGFTWTPTGTSDFVIRGGSGLFYSDVDTQAVVNQLKRNGEREIGVSFPNDGRPGFVSNPTRGVTADDVLSGRVAVTSQVIAPLEHDYAMPYSWQTTIGFQKQLSQVMGIDGDLVYQKGYRENIGSRDPNLFYDPVTGLPKPPAVFGRPRPDYGPITLWTSHGKSDYLALPLSVTRRYRNHFQAGATYTLMFFKNNLVSPDNPFDFSTGWGRAADFQRHTFRVNGIWNLPADITVSGSYRFGSGNYFQITSGVDPLGISSTRIRKDLTLIPRNTFPGDNVQTLDMRVSKVIPVTRLKVILLAEVFNITNAASYSYNMLENSSAFGQRTGTIDNPRSGQLGFKVEW